MVRETVERVAAKTVVCIEDAPWLPAVRCIFNAPYVALNFKHQISFGPALLSGMPLTLALGGPGTRDGPAWVGRLSLDSYR
jgi:hypothetical protein